MTYTRRPRVRVDAPPDDTWDRVFHPSGFALHYNRAGQPCSLREWTEAFEDHRRRFLGRDYVLGAWVATIYDGLNHDIVAGARPTMFETTVFRKDRFGHRQSGKVLPEGFDGYQVRYTSERDALKGHWGIRLEVRKAQQQLNGPPPLAVTVKRKKRQRGKRR